MRTVSMALAMVALLAASAWAGPTYNDFEGGGTAYSVGTNGVSPPQVLAGGPSGSFLRLVDATKQSAASQVGFDQTALGLASTVVAEFDFRLDPGGVFGQADGLGIALLRTAYHGAAGSGPYFNEEPDLDAGGGLGPSFGLGLDIYNNGGIDQTNNNHGSLHYGSKLTQASPSFDLSTDQFHHAMVKIDYVPQGGEVTVAVTPNSLSGSPGATETLFDKVFVAGLTPYASRIAFTGRTGGETAHHDIDNVSVKTLSNPDDFNYQPDFAGANPADFVLTGTAVGLTTDNGGNTVLQVTNHSPNQRGAIWLADKKMVEHGFVTEFDFEFPNAPNSGADGMSFVVHNRAEGTGLNPGEGGPGASALSIGFDSYDNGASDPSAAVLRVNAGGTILATVDLATAPYNIPDLTNSGVHSVRLEYAPGNLDLFFDGVLVAGDLDVWLGAIGALDANGEAWMGFGARTGGAQEDHNVLRWSLATPVPEPATLSLLGLGALALIRRRRR